jgi:protein TonB
MKYLVVTVLLLPFFSHLHAQDTAKVASVKLSNHEKPKFPGGDAELREFLTLNLRYPNEAMEHKVEGEVIISFKIDGNGNISEPKSLKSLGYGCDEEAINVVRKMPQWIPAEKNGKKIAVIYNLPIVFELPKNAPDNSN